MQAKVPDLSKSKIVFLLGGPGSGKGTQSDLLIKDYGYKHISTGDLFREEIKNVRSMTNSHKTLLEIANRTQGSSADR